MERPADDCPGLELLSTSSASASDFILVGSRLVCDCCISYQIFVLLLFIICINCTNNYFNIYLNSYIVCIFNFELKTLLITKYLVKPFNHVHFH